MATRPMDNRTKTMPKEQSDTRQRAVLSENQKFFSDAGVEYQVFAREYLGQGGQATVYRGERVSDKQPCGVRVEDLYASNPTSDENRARVQQFLKQYSDKPEYSLLPLLDTGEITYTVLTNLGAKKAYTSPIEILPLCDAILGEKITYSEIKQTLLPAMAKALHNMHENGLIHRDVKPSNVYRYGQRYALGDFGASVAISTGLEANYCQTLTRRITPGYSGPEVRNGYAVPASDWYSLGITIASCYKGEHPYQTLLDQHKKGLVGEGAINKAMNDNGIPLDCPKAEQDLQVLVNALTRGNENDRPGYEDILLWCKDSAAFAQKYNAPTAKTTSQKTVNTAAFSYSFKGAFYHDLPMLGAAFVASKENWEVAKADLYRGSVKGSMLYAHLKMVDQELARLAADIIEARDTAYDQDLGLAKLIYHMAPQLPLVWKGACYYKLTDISTAFQEKTISQTDMLAMFQNGYLQWRLKKDPSTNAHALEAVQKVMRFATEAPELAAYLVQLQFAPKMQSYRGATDADALFGAITKDTKVFYANLSAFLYDKKMLAYLAFLGWQDAVQDYLRHCTNEHKHDLQFFYRLFEVVCSNPARVRTHYITAGPDGDLYWLGKNLDCYQYTNPSAQKIRVDIVASHAQLTEKQTIGELSQTITKLRQYKAAFLAELQNDILLASFALGDCSKGIHTVDVDAFYAQQFFGERVPLAFYRTVCVNTSA